MKTGETVLLAGFAGLLGGGLVYLLTRGPPVAAVTPVAKKVPGGLSFPFLENHDPVDPVAAAIY